MTPPMRVQDLLQRLEAIGLSRKYVRSMLPDWLSDEAVATPGGLLELKLILSRQFDLDAGRLLSEGAEVAFRATARRRFKKARGVDTGDLVIASGVAVGVARHVAAMCGIPFAQLPSAGEQARAATFQMFPPLRFVSLQALLHFSWAHGVPVIYLASAPPGNRKMDAMAVDVEGRPVIVVSRASAHASWISFLVAHELGHIARGDVRQDVILIDSASDDNDPFIGAEDDQDELDANRYAIGLLTGDPERRYLPDSGGGNAPGLLAAAQAESVRSKVDPGHIILSFGHHTRQWPMAMAALNALHSPDPAKTINEVMLKHIDIKVLGSDAEEFVRKATGL